MAHEPAGTVKSVVSLFENGLAPKFSAPPFAVTVITPVPHVTLAPTLALPQESVVGLADVVPNGVPETENETPLPDVGVAVMVALLAPVLPGVKLAVTVQD